MTHPIYSIPSSLASGERGSHGLDPAAMFASTDTPVLWEPEDPYRFYLACDDSNPPDWEIAQKHLKPKPGIVVVEMLPAPSRVGEIWLPSVALETRVDDEVVPGFESSQGVVLAVGSGVGLSPGQRVLCVDGDGVEIQDFTAGAYRAKGKVRFFGLVAPAEDDTFHLPYQGYLEPLPYDESLVAIMENDDLKPTTTNILIEKDPFAHTSQSGLLLLPDIGQERPSLATVIECGPDCRETKASDRILFHPEGELGFQDATNPNLRMIRELAILTVIEEVAASEPVESEPEAILA